MYQKFDLPKTAPYKKRIQALRVLLAKRNLNGFLIPRADLYQNEFIEPCDARLEWLTGFTGSAGLCLVTLDSAFIFVDGRYKIQVKNETDKSLFQIIQSSEISFKNWFKINCKTQAIGYDPWLHTVAELTTLIDSDNNKINLIKCNNLIDVIWRRKPKRTPQLIKAHPKQFSGTESKTKRRQLSKSLLNSKTDAVVLTKPDSICWLLNIRGNDVRYTPIIQSLAVVHKSCSIKLFLRKKDLSKEMKVFLGDDVEVLDHLSFSKYILSLKEQTIQIDPASCPVAVLDLLKMNNNKILQKNDPCSLPKAIKNLTEIKGARSAHLVDAIAFIKFLHWFYTKIDPTQLDEIGITQKLEEFRVKTGLLKEIAFDTICGSGSNGAIVHYKVTRKTNKKIQNNNLLLIDSGGQYQTGTTDLTRTIAIGTPNKKMIDVFTLVLKGMITISDLNWPNGLSGKHLDSLARVSLWSRGLDYDHGTGHGVGSYLSVHEGPHGLSKRNNVPLQEGMLISNEPGYYKKGEFGIRIENILLVKKRAKTNGHNGEMLGFETLTLIPIDRKLINVALLTDDERRWLNNYHSLVFKKISPLLPQNIQTWLQKHCAPI